MIKSIEKNNKKQSYYLSKYNIKEVNLPIIEKLYIKKLLEEKKYTSKHIQKVHLKVVKVIMTMAYQLRTAVNHKVSSDDKTKYYSTAIIVPSDSGFYAKATFKKRYSNLDYMYDLIKHLNCGVSIINTVLKNLEDLNIIEITKGYKRGYDKDNDFEILNKYIQAEKGKFRTIRVLSPIDWCVSLVDVEYLPLMIYNDLEMVKYSKTNKKERSNDVVYRDKSKLADKTNNVFDKQTLKYKKSSSYLEYYKKDSLEKELNILNEFIVSKCGELFKMKKVHGNTVVDFGRLFSTYNGLSKEIRYKINKSLGITEEVDMTSAVFNTLALTEYGKTFEFAPTKNDVYLAIGMFLPAYKDRFVKTEKDWIKLGYSNFSSFTEYTDNNDVTYLVNYNKLSKYRNLFKSFFMSFYGNNTEVKGKASLRNTLFDLGMYYNYSNACTTNIDKLREFEISKKEESIVELLDSNTDSSLVEEKINDLNRTKDIISKNNVSWNKTCTEILGEDLDFIGTTDNEIVEAYSTVMNISGFSKLKDYLFTDVYSYTQNIESLVMMELLREAKNDDIVIGAVHDAVYVTPEYKDKYENLMLVKFKEHSVNNKAKLHNLKKEQIKNKLTYLKNQSEYVSYLNNLEISQKELIKDIEKEVITLTTNFKGSKKEFVAYVNDNIKQTKVLSLLKDFRSKFNCEKDISYNQISSYFNVFLNIDNIKDNINIIINNLYNNKYNIINKFFNSLYYTMNSQTEIKFSSSVREVGWIPIFN